MARGYAANRLANATDAPWTGKTWVRQARGEYRISRREREEAAGEAAQQSNREVRRRSANAIKPAANSAVIRLGVN